MSLSDKPVPAIKAYSNVSPAELVYGTTLRLPGDFFDEHPVIKSPEKVVEKLSDMFYNFTPAPTKSHHIAKPFVAQGLKTNTHIFVRRDGVRKGLQAPYDGPSAVVKRGDKLYKVNIKGKLVNISIDILNIAFIADDGDITISSGKDTGKSRMAFPCKTKSGRTVRFPSRVQPYVMTMHAQFL
ncbi:hypothetical protein AVEN_101909-1 [Araneus ventricosus]|uniref:Uncharacterized protein n=1 Tax=Araneus ventricosus TaxID=182803 RepID=A0A4Y2D5V9_ARAVE|nr:hypothetical protein AVEN_240632-1 [Araneus ventricosus]GBM13059.1 hypothetical protein AVEN_101909-1 [Araneus ventricosus]